MEHNNTNLINIQPIVNSNPVQHLINLTLHDGNINGYILLPHIISPISHQLASSHYIPHPIINSNNTTSNMSYVAVNNMNSTMNAFKIPIEPIIIPSSVSLSPSPQTILNFKMNMPKFKYISNIFSKSASGIEVSNKNAIKPAPMPPNINTIIKVYKEPKIANKQNYTYKCNECSKTFKHKTNLKIHSKIHSSDALVCSFCLKRFARKTNLKQHLRVHTNEKPFKCEQCVKAFKQRHSLIDHIRTHTGERPHKCEFCSKTFSARCNYMVHRRIHTGEKPYKCTICDKRFTSKSGYNAHKKSRH